MLPNFRSTSLLALLAGVGVLSLAHCSSDPEPGAPGPARPATSPGEAVFRVDADLATHDAAPSSARPARPDAEIARYGRAALSRASVTSRKLLEVMPYRGGFSRDGAAFVSPGARGLGSPELPRLAIRGGLRAVDAVELSSTTPEFGVRLEPIGASSDADGGRVDGRLAYEGVWQRTDVVRAADEGHFREFIVMNEPSAPRMVGYQVTRGAGLHGVVPQADGSLLFVDEEGLVRLSLAAPVAVDAVGREVAAELAYADDRVQLTVPVGLTHPIVLAWGADGVAPGKKPPPPPPVTQIKPRIMVLFDTSGSMVWHFNDSTTCGGDGDAQSLYTDVNVTNQNFYPGIDGTNSRMYAAKKALQSAVSASTNFDFGLMRYIPDSACPNTTTCCNLAQGPCFCTWDLTNYVIPNCAGQPGGLITWGGGCGTLNGGGGQILVNPSATSGSAILPWVDNVEDFRTGGGTFGRNPELRPAGPTPLARAVLSARQDWYQPILTTSKNNPGCSGATCDPQIDCRPYVLVAMTDGEDSCEATAAQQQNRPPAQVKALRDLNPANPVTTYVIGVGFVGSSVLDNMAAEGGSTKARFANNQAQIQAAFADIAAASVKFEVCNGADDTCNGIVDEGLGAYQECAAAGQCASNTCSAGRCACTTSAQCLAGFACDGGFCRPGCTVGAGECLRTGVRKCDSGGTTCCAADGQAACTKLQPGAPAPTELCNGKDDNCNGIIDEGGVCQGCQASPEVCDGKDNDCDGTIDNNLTDTNKPCGLNLGECKPGTTACEADAGFTFPHATDHLVCKNATGPGPEVCDGKDNDCDGVVDGQIEACYTGPAGTSGVGVCVGGKRACSGGVPGACVGEVTPGAEVCDGLDNDCNGKIDDLPGIDQPCCSSGKCGTGICVSGTLKCSGGAPQCIGEVKPATEICDGKDNDCNGQVDDLANGPGQIGTACCTSGKCGKGVCAGGVWGCGPNGLECVGEVKPSTELCDMKDNDCNDVVDDIPGAGLDCCPSGACGTGVCKGGKLKCTPTGLLCDGAVGGSAEVCDGLDNDCNGLVDDVPGVNEACCPDGGPAPESCNKGVCSPGVKKCDAMTGKLVCDGAKGAGKEVCDGLDNDCNGMIDDKTEVNDPAVGKECDPPPTGKTNLPCKAGKTVCSGGKVACDGAVKPGVEVCDDFDNDCDGVKDNGNLCGNDRACVTGLCVAACSKGEFECPGGFTCQNGYCVPVGAGQGGAGGAGGASSGGKSGASGTGGASSGGKSGGGAGGASSGGKSGAGGNGATSSGGKAGAQSGGTSAAGGPTGSATAGAGGSTDDKADNFGLTTGGGGCDAGGHGPQDRGALLLLGAAVVGLASRRRRAAGGAK